ncbi:MazG nucleotide pyrophosphohydrolase domain-containing protein [Gordonia sp. 'Campus']|uniref:MazG nucleotide pyrophosphohydrolase domain-containing protein n=1 Tax=Gordonia sp. 'Campus' TaxID=2915824 RepID=UPI001EE483ED|nr:MazG nucleotide pyrophosphohydrolase domain-containing protein [Gordonia sp. 'Campus']
MEISEFVRRQQEFDSRRGVETRWSAAISEQDTSALMHNSLALAGEVGELANLVKKYDRGDFPFAHLLDLLPGELADIAIYVVKLAYQSGIDLEAALLAKLSENENRFPRIRE